MSEETAPPILPSVATVLGPAKARLKIVRPRAAKHVEKGNYAVPFTAWRGQFTRIRARLAAEVKAAFLGTSTGDELSFLAASNFDTPRATAGATAAIGNVLLTRTVVHYLPLSANVVSAADATNLATLTALLTQIRSVFNTHGASVYAAGTGSGAHAAAETVAMGAPVVTTMGDVVATVNVYKSETNAHLASTTPHLFADTVNPITTADAFASDGATAFSAQTLASQQSALTLATAIKRALNVHVALKSPAGTFRESDRFRVAADPTAVPPTLAGEYVVSRNTVAPTGSYVARVPVRAIAPGPGANAPLFDPPSAAALSVVGSLYDAAETLRWSPRLSRMAGGTNGQSDALLTAAASANWQGSYGPTDRALVAGVLRFPGLARGTIMRDTATGTSIVYAVDESWAQSPEWQAAIEQYLRTDWKGVGCRLTSGAVINRVVRVELSVVLRNRRDLADTTTITAALQVAVANYFEKRPDWWVFRLATLRGVCSRAHRKILKCVEATVLDSTGAPIAEPAQPVAGAALTHWWFANGLDVVFDAAAG